MHISTDAKVKALRPPVRRCTFGNMVTYSLGEGANSLVMNGIFGFALLFYTKALGLNPQWAGFAMSISVFWEAVTEPAMGHISDHTRSWWGRRHLYMLIGGLLMALCSYLIWAVPESIRTHQVYTFWYLVTMNLALRTGLTLFFIPYLALGFEMTDDYEERSKIQGLRSVFNMAANFAGPALAWTFFFQEKTSTHATSIVANYVRMGAIFALATAVLVLIAVAGTWRWRVDTRDFVPASNAVRAAKKVNVHGLSAFWKNISQIALDPHARWVFVFIFIVDVGMVLVASLQMFVYDDFMGFSSTQKSIAHGSTMVGFALGSALSVWLVGRMDKKGTVLLGCVLSVICSLMLGVLFLTGWVATDCVVTWGGIQVPLSLVLFVLFHAGYWMGNGILLPIATAMMADVAEIHRLKTGESKVGGYSAVFSLATRLAISFSLVASGWALALIGFRVSGSTETAAQTAAALWNLGLVTFVVGAGVAALAMLALWRYPISKAYLESIRVHYLKHHPLAPGTLLKTLE